MAPVPGAGVAPQRGPSGDRAAGGAGPAADADHAERRRSACACGLEYPAPQPALLEPECGRRLEPPRCGQCGGRVRPGVVWFGESLPRLAWEQAVQAAQGCGAFLCVGTSSIVEPAASLTRVAIAAGSVTIQVNIDSTWLDDLVTLNLCGPAASMLPELVAEVWPQA